jgi:GDP-mannose 6-dehydrogenase
MLLNVTVFGLGHIGLVTSLFIADSGHTVTGIEITKEKVELLNNKQLYISEKNLPEIFQKTFKKNFFATTEISFLEEIVFVCVGTPPLINGSVDLTQIQSTTECIGKLINSSNKIHQIVFRSTFPPGTIENIIIPILTKMSLKKLNEDYFVYYFPEFLREGSAWEDINVPSLNVWGSYQKKDIPSFYKSLGFDKKELTVVNYKTGEMIKYLNNSFHALKITFANEMANIASSLDVEINELFDVFLQDTKLNVSDKYLRPGFAFGGPCLPKEIKGINMLARNKSIELPLSHSILISNEDQIKRFITSIEKSNYKNIGISGISFKPATSDLRNSPLLDVIQYFSQKPKYQGARKFYIYDPNIIRKDFESLNLKNAVLAETLEEMIEFADSLILGPYELKEKEIPQIIMKIENIIDLLYFKKNPEYQKAKNYLTLFDLEN